MLPTLLHSTTHYRVRPSVPFHRHRGFDRVDLSLLCQSFFVHDWATEYINSDWQVMKKHSFMVAEENASSSLDVTNAQL